MEATWIMKSPRSLFATFLIGVAVGAPVIAIDEGGPTFFESVDVNVVNVETVVTDRHGVRVPDLSADDFQLFVDGQLTPIEFFSEIRGGDVISKQGEAGALPSVVPGRPVGTSYLVFVDEFFTIPGDRRRVLSALEDELGFLGPEDRMAVVAWDGSKVEMLSTWSQSQRDLTQALRAAAQRPSYGTRRLAELRNFEHGRGLLFNRRVSRSGSSNYLDPEERAYIDLLRSQLENGVASASASLRGFGNPPGRKVMLLLTGGWADQPAEYAVADPYRLLFEREYRFELYSPMTETANLLGYTLYPVDVAGLEASGITNTASGAFLGIFSDRDFYREQEVHYGLERIARDTGGIALINGQRDAPLGEVAADTRSYYWLGFTPTRVGDDRPHDIRVQALPKALRVRTRQGYSDLSRSQELAMATESALIFGNPAGAMALEVEIGEAVRAGWGKIELPITVRLPLSDLTLIPTGENWVGSLELRVAVQDENGNRAAVPVIPISIARIDEPQGDDLWTFQTTLKMRSRDHDMLFALHDKASGETFASNASFLR